MRSTSPPAAVLVTMIAGLMPCTAAAQTGVPAAWTSCAPSPGQDLVLGTRTILWKDVTAPRQAEVRLGSRLPSRPPSPPSDPAARTDEPVADPFERVFCAQPSPQTFPSERASHALVLFVAAKSELTFTRVEIYRGATLIAASDGAAPQHNMLLSSQPLWPAPSKIPTGQAAGGAERVLAAEAADSRLFVIVSREDAGPQLAQITVSIEEEPLAHDTKFERGKGWFVKSLSEGNAFLYMADPTSYDRLLNFARCDWVADDARRAPSLPAAASATGCLSTQMAALRNEIYPFVSTLTGRGHRLEFQDGQPRAPLSEPMVVFFGLGGSNKILLLDCRHISGPGDRRECDNYAEPWQTTLERARYVWAVYIEDEQTPFNTSIDVEFKPKAPTVDYEEYDPRGLARPPAAPGSPAAGASRFLRIGYRRLRIREPPVAVQLAFSRQGPNYGLRQWVRVYRQFSTRWWVVSGAVFVPGTNNGISHIELVPNLPVEGGPATRARIVDDEPLAPVYATLLWRWPQVRGFAENQARGSMRLLVNLIPDVAGGLSLPPRRHNSYLVGGSWPILADRLSFIMGLKTFRDERPANGFVVGQYVPADTSIGEIRGEPHRHVDLLFGLAVELVRSR